MDEDLFQMTRDKLIEEVRRLRLSSNSFTSATANNAGKSRAPLLRQTFCCARRSEMALWRGIREAF
jgi:hypothetical protein